MLPAVLIAGFATDDLAGTLLFAFANQVAHGVGRLRAALQPVADALVIELQLYWFAARVVMADDFNETAVAL